MIEDEPDHSAAVGGDLALDGLALHANQFGVLAAVAAEGIAPETAGEEEEAQAPGNGHTADGLSGDLASVLAAGGTGRPRVTSSASHVDDHGTSGGRGWGRRIIGRWRSSVHAEIIKLI